MIERVDHVGIAVPSLEEALRFWRDALGMEVAGEEEVGTERVKVAFLPAGESRVELLEATSKESPIARHLEKRGAGIHHLTLAVTDLEGALARIRARGLPMLDEAPRPGAGGSRVAFVHPRAAGGVLLELVEAGSRAAGAAIGPGKAVLLYAKDPGEKLFGILSRIDASGVTLEGLDLGSFEDWMAQVDRGDALAVGPSVLFVPMGRVEKILLDRRSGSLPSLSERFFARTGRTVASAIGRGSS